MGNQVRSALKVRAKVSKSEVVLESTETHIPVETLPIIQACIDHRNFILSTWVKSYMADARAGLTLFNYRSSMKMRFSDFLETEKSYSESAWRSAMVVTSPDNEFTIHAWIAAENDRLWHVYVSPDLRGLGIGKGLVEAFLGREYVTHKPWPMQPKGHNVHWKMVSATE